MQLDPARIVPINSINYLSTIPDAAFPARITPPAQPMRTSTTTAYRFQKLVSLPVLPQLERSNGFYSDGLRRLFGMNQGVNSDYTMTAGSPVVGCSTGAIRLSSGVIWEHWNRRPAQSRPLFDRSLPPLSAHFRPNSPVLDPSVRTYVDSAKTRICEFPGDSLTFSGVRFWCAST